jgi:hypothetical protein
MKLIALSALTAEQRALIGGAREVGARPTATGVLSKPCQVCRHSFPWRELAPDPAGRYQWVCPACLRLRVKGQAHAAQRDETLTKT